MDNSVTGVLVAGAIMLTICIVLGLVRLCCRSSQSDPSTKLAYPVAISNRLFNVMKKNLCTLSRIEYSKASDDVIKACSNTSWSTNPNIYMVY